MTLTIQFNDNAPQTMDVLELHVYFDKNMLELVTDGQAMNIYRELNDLNFPNQSLILTVAQVQNP